MPDSEDADQPSAPRRGRSPRRADRASKPFKPNWKERLAYGSVVAFFFAFTIVFVAPLEVVGGSSGSLMYAMGDVWWVLIAPVLGMVAFITLVLVLLRGDEARAAEVQRAAESLGLGKPVRLSRKPVLQP